MHKKIIISAILLSGIVFADEGGRDVAPAKNTMYLKECASCHFGYQPGLLPKRSWTKMMNNLDNHFGTDASLDPKTKAYITRYLTLNSADSVNAGGYKRSYKINNSISTNQAPLRISQTPYFLREHREVPKQAITQKAVGSLANCTACHTTAFEGSYSERAIKIPNFRNWEEEGDDD
ncbi:MAG: diheme cytochrome c [Sulfurovaceae bacterium]|nr:diheme cytochrome c [Sulfurovaceae bacterium]